MPKIKKCPHCGEELYCKVCGRRFTPGFLGWKKKLHISKEAWKLLEEQASREGVDADTLLKERLGKRSKIISRPQSTKATPTEPTEKKAVTYILRRRAKEEEPIPQATSRRAPRETEERRQSEKSDRGSSRRKTAG